jgi:hypothetical protein
VDIVGVGKHGARDPAVAPSFGTSQDVCLPLAIERR